MEASVINSTIKINKKRKKTVMKMPIFKANMGNSEKQRKHSSF